MMHFICALQAEAQALIQHYALSHCHDSAPFKIYQDKKKCISLTVSGVGMLAAAQAVIHTHHYFAKTPYSVWLNTGICGHAEHAVSTPFLIKKITAAGSARSWYPQFCFETELAQEDILTVDKPEFEYGSSLYDMECAGFYDACSRLTTAEFIHAIKIVADNRSNPATRLNKHIIAALIETNLAVIRTLATKLLTLAAEHAAIHLPALQLIEQLCAEIHFTEYQKNQLRQLIPAWTALNRQADTLLKQIQPSGTAPSIIEFLHTALAKRPFE